MSKQDRAAKRGIERHAYPAQFEVRAKPDGSGGTKYQLDGYASVYDTPFEMWDAAGPFDEIVRQGSGAKTLSESPDVVFVYDHQGMPLARTKNGSLRLSEDSTGLHSNAPELNGSRDVVREVVSAVEEGLLDEMSFAFRVTRQEWSPDFAQRDILEYSLHRGDVSVVAFGANPATSIALRARDLDQMSDDSARALYERLGRRLAPAPPVGLSLDLARALAERDDSMARHLKLTGSSA